MSESRRLRLGPTRAEVLHHLRTIAQAAPVQEFNVQLKDVKPDGRYTIVFTANSFDTSGEPPPLLTSNTVRFAAGVNIRKEFMTSTYKCDVGLLRDALIAAKESGYFFKRLDNLAATYKRVKGQMTPESRKVTETCIRLLAKAPTIVAYNYNVSRYRQGSGLRIITPDPELSTAENFLYMLRGTRPHKRESMLFDLSLMLHAEHGGGNNSTFTVRAVSSSGANTYMAICSGIASLSGHLHGGANEAVMRMMREIRKNVKDWEDRRQVRRYLEKILDGKAHDRAGKIYGIGHAVYTISDPRAEILLEKAEELATEKELMDELNLMKLVAELGSELVYERKGQVVAPNVDFYSGFVYKMLRIPIDLFTPIFAMARIAGWSAHRIEQIIQAKLIRPAYVSSLLQDLEYVPLDERG